MIPPSGLTAKYLESLRSANYAASTIYKRGRIIVRFRLVVGLDPLEADEHQFIGWWTGLTLAPHSRAVELSSLRHYCKWAVRHDYIAKDPSRLLDRPRVGRRYPRPIDEVSLARAIAAADRETRVILCLAAFGGLRACEIAALDWADVQRDTVLLHGKGNKERVVPLHPFIVETLNLLPGKRRGPVIIRRDGVLGHVMPQMISQRANHHLHDLGIPETLHQLRHRFATQLYQLSRDIRLCQDVLGHASPDTTALYTQWDKKDASVAVFKLPTSA